MIGTHDALERLLQGYKLAYNARRQRRLGGRSSDEAVRERLADKPELANPTYLPSSPCDLNKAKVAAQLTVHSAKDVSSSDS